MQCLLSSLQQEHDGFSVQISCSKQTSADAYDICHPLQGTDKDEEENLCSLNMKSVLVTGGNRGIGLEICRQLHARGYQVIMGSRDIESGHEAAARLGINVSVQQLDVTDPGSVQNAFEHVERAYGSLDVLINNAGLGSTFFSNQRPFVSGISSFLKTKLPGGRQLINILKPVLRRTPITQKIPGPSDIALSEVRLLMETNFYGPWNMIQSFLPLLRKSPGGRIINMSSGMGEFASLAGNYPAYRLSKASLNSLTIMLAKELEDEGIRINAMCPGWVRTDMGGPDAPRSVEEGADTAVWLATEEETPTGKFFRDRMIIDW